MDPELLSQFRQRFVAFDRRQRHLRLKRGPVIPSCSLHCLAPLVRHLLVASVKPGYHLAHCPNFRGPLCELLECIWSQGSYPPWGISRSLPGHVEEKDDFRFSTIGYPMVHCDTRCRAMPRRATSKITRSINDKSLTPLFALWQRVFRCVYCCEWSES